ncbi:ABC-2 family transporter protein [Phycisphaerae bacterium RAS1]|nr:ABC-2 family transporter protein [Phycisphaerae bacterium RAS1]
MRMSRFSRINTIWRKELTDTLRDRRTLLAMVLVPMVLYPALMLGSLQAFELQATRLKSEKFTVGVSDAGVQRWLNNIITTDIVRRGGAAPESQPADGSTHSGAAVRETAVESARSDLRETPPEFEVVLFGELRGAVEAQRVHVGLMVDGALPTLEGADSACFTMIFDQTDVRSGLAATGLGGILERASRDMALRRLERAGLPRTVVTPIEIIEQSVATPEKVSGSILGQIVPLILIIMTITGAIYPAIDLTAGERERGTLETLIVAPVPTVDLIVGKFIVVALIGMLSAMLNLLSIGGTVYLGGLGQILSRGGPISIPLSALPWVLLILVPLAVMFSALLLAVSSFARSFKEAQNYIMPVMIAGLIPAVVGVLPGTRLEGPLLIMPVTNIVVLTRELFMGRVDLIAIMWVTVSTTIYAGAAVAVAAKLFGQEAVLFADSGSIKSLFVRRFFKPSERPATAHALLLLAIVFSLNFFIQQSMQRSPQLAGQPAYYYALAGLLVLLLVAAPLGAAVYMRSRLASTFLLSAPPPRGLLAGVCIGASTWVLAPLWFVWQETWMPLPAGLAESVKAIEDSFATIHPLVLLLVLAVIPGICEELFFRGYVMSGLRSTFTPVAAVLLAAAAFGFSHYLAQRLALTFMLGAVLGLLAMRFRSIWPAMIAHVLHNGLTLAGSRDALLKPLLSNLGYPADPLTSQALPWLLGAAAIFLAGLALCLIGPRRDAPAARESLLADRSDPTSLPESGPAHQTAV